MSAWCDVAVCTHDKSRKDGLVVRGTAGPSCALRPGMGVAFVPPVLDAPREARVRSVRDVGDGLSLVAFEGVDTPELAAALAGCHILARRADLPIEAARTGSQGIVGYDVVDAQLGMLGTVAGIVENPAQSLIEIAAPGRDAALLVPFVDEFVRAIDDDARRVDTCVPAGLVDL